MKDAWNYYLQHDNKGRGVVLVAHSQGSFILNRLIREEIDGKPIQSRMVSAILLGTTLAVPKGKDVGGSFQQRAALPLGVADRLRDHLRLVPLDGRPPANTLFGKVPDANMVAACTNPAALGGGSGAVARVSRRTGRTITSNAPAKPWVTPEQKIETPWVSVPGSSPRSARRTRTRQAISRSRCNGDPNDPRVDDITGDIGVGTQRPGELGTAPGRRQSRDWQPAGHRRTGDEGVRREA